jgi:hypothetical protein
VRFSVARRTVRARTPVSFTAIGESCPDALNGCLPVDRTVVMGSRIEL